MITKKYLPINQGGVIKNKPKVCAVAQLYFFLYESKKIMNKCIPEHEVSITFGSLRSYIACIEFQLYRMNKF